MSKAKLGMGFLSGLVIGLLGGLIGLGGAEFRLPLLIGIFSFGPLEALILNKAMSLIVVSVALPARAQSVPFDTLAQHWVIIVNLLSGSIIGAWVGAGWATKMRSAKLYRVIAILLVVVAIILMVGHDSHGNNRSLFTGHILLVAGTITGFGVGIFASLLGVAGGEILIPAIVLLYGIDIKIAGSLSLAISLPTMLTAFTRYSRDKSFVVIKQHIGFVFIMAVGSVTGTFMGGKWLGVFPSHILLPVLSVILLTSSYKIWQHKNNTGYKQYCRDHILILSKNKKGEIE